MTTPRRVGSSESTSFTSPCETTTPTTPTTPWYGPGDHDSHDSHDPMVWTRRYQKCVWRGDVPSAAYSVRRDSPISGRVRRCRCHGNFRLPVPELKTAPAKIANAESTNIARNPKMTSGKKGQPAFGRILVERDGHVPYPTAVLAASASIFSSSTGVCQLRSDGTPSDSVKSSNKMSARFRLIPIGQWKVPPLDILNEKRHTPLGCLQEPPNPMFCRARST